MCGSDYYNEPQAQLAAKLCSLFPGKSPTRVFFTNSGAESIEAAFKLARYHTKRQGIIAFIGAFHGRSLGALSLTASKAVQRRGFGPRARRANRDHTRVGCRCSKRYRRTVLSDCVVEH